MNVTLRQSLRPLGLLGFAAALGAIALLAILPASLPRTTSYDSGLPALGWLFWLLLTLALWWQTRGPDTFGAAALRGLRAFALIALAVAIGLIATLAAWAVLPDLPGFTNKLFGDLVKEVAEFVLRDTPISSVYYHFEPTALGILGLLGCALSIGLWLWLLRWKSWRLHVAVAPPTAATLCYLAWDDADARILTLDQVAPLPPRGAESAALLRSFRYPNPPPWRAFLEVQGRWGFGPRSDNFWRVFVAANRETIRAGWQASQAAREWILALDQFEVIGDTSTAATPFAIRRDQRRVLEDLVPLYCAYASALAIDGRPDEALDTLRTMLSVCRKLQPAARELRRLWWARGVQEDCQVTARMILRVDSPGPAALRALAEVLARPASPGVDEARAHAFYSTDLKASATALSPVARLFYQPRATSRLYVEGVASLASAFAEGRGEELRNLVERMGPRSFKNALGHFDAWQNYNTAERFRKRPWQADDQRRALLAEVQAKLAEAGKKEATK